METEANKERRSANQAEYEKRKALRVAIYKQMLERKKTRR